MLIEFRILPLGCDPHISQEIAEAIKILDIAGLRYQMTPSSTCIEGEWDEIMPVLRLCHEQVRRMSPHVVTEITVEDDADEEHQISRNIASVEEKVGHPVTECPDPQPPFFLPQANPHRLTTDGGDLHGECDDRIDQERDAYDFRPSPL